MHLLAEFEQMTHSEVQANKKKDQAENKQKALRVGDQQGGGRQDDKPSSVPQSGDQTRDVPACRFFLSDGRRGDRASLVTINEMNVEGAITVDARIIWRLNAPVEIHL